MCLLKYVFNRESALFILNILLRINCNRIGDGWLYLYVSCRVYSTAVGFLTNEGKDANNVQNNKYQHLFVIVFLLFLVCWTGY
jgi:hypothetical protein